MLPLEAFLMSSAEVVLKEQPRILNKHRDPEYTDMNERHLS